MLLAIDPFFGSLAQGAANLGSGLLNLIGVNKTNKNNLKIMREQNKFNLEQWQREADFTREMWNANNEYNDPSAQMERLEAAGLSPWAASDAVTGGESSAVSTPAGSPAVGYEPTAMNFDFIGEATSRAFEQYMRQREFELQATKQAKENAILDEQLAQQKIKTAVDTEFGLSVGQANLDNLLLDQHNKSTMLRYLCKHLRIMPVCFSCSKITSAVRILSWNGLFVSRS